MTRPPTDVVVAGTKSFAVALLAPLTARVGVPPRIAADAGQALGLCRGPGGLVVIEYLGDASLAGIEQLVREGDGLRVVAGVPQAHAAAEASLRALGVEIARWDGRPDALLVAVERQISAAVPAAGPSLVRPAAAMPVPPRAPPGAAPASTKPPVAVAPRPGPAAVVPVQAPAPRSSNAAKPAVPAEPGALPAVPAVAPAAPALFASSPKAPAIQRVAPAAAAKAAPTKPAVAAAPPTAASTAARPAVLAAPPSPVFAPATANAPPAAVLPPPASVAARPAPDAAALFDGFQTDDPFAPDAPIDVDVDEAIAAIEPSAPLMYVPPPAAAPAAVADWPATAPSSSEAEAALLAVLAGSTEPTGVGVVAAQVAAALSDLERQILGGAQPPALDPQPIRRAAVTHVRVAAALACAPAPGSAVDAGAVHAFLGEIDALLSAVGVLASGAPPEQQASLDAIRNALVKEAIDFSEAAQRIGPDTSSASRTAPMPRTSARAAQARVLSVSAGQERAPRRSGSWILLAAALLAAGGYHAYRYASHQRALSQVRTIPGAPDGMMLAVGGPGTTQVLVPLRGTVPDRGQVERFRASKESEGFEVRELAGGVLELRRIPEPPRRQP